jgi:serine/threonine protein kinase
VPVPLAELAAATAGWAAARKVGEGGFGVVYRADALPSRPVLGPVAIKRLAADSQQGLNELMSEVQLLGTCRHEHLLPLLAFCYEGGVGCLVYPLMAGGSLEDRLVRDDDASRRLASLLPAAGAARPPLTWQQRLRAVRDATRALVFLHTPTATRPVILHRDIKPANVLLDLEGNAKLADGVPPYPCLALALTAAVVPPILPRSHRSPETLSLAPPCGPPFTPSPETLSRLASLLPLIPSPPWVPLTLPPLQLALPSRRTRCRGGAPT